MEFFGVVRLVLDSGFILDLEDVIYVPSMRRILVSIGNSSRIIFFAEF